MPPETDQQKFDDDVNRIGKRVLGIAAGLGIVAALSMSAFALVAATNPKPTVMMTPVSSARAAVPSTATISIEHVLHGCHALAVNGSPASSPDATIHLATGGTLSLRDNDVMPHQLVLVSGPKAQITGAAMNHMGATSQVVFPTAGTYTFTTKAGEDYMAGVTTIGNDNVIKLQVVVGPSGTAA